MTYFLLFLGGDAKLLVMLCVSPAQRFITETLQCLGFGSRARQVARGQTKKRRPTSFVPNSISLGLSVVCVWLYYLRSSGPSSFFFGLRFFNLTLTLTLTPFSLAFAFSSPPPERTKKERKGREREEKTKNTSSHVFETWNLTVNRQ